MNKSLESVAMPQVLMKIVERVKEIVDCSEAEIYETLKDCDMEPNEAVSRLLTQDHFQEVKRKPEKKKEGKDNEIVFSSSNNGSSRGIESRADRYVDHGEPISMQGRLTYWKESEPTGCMSNTPPVSDVPGNNKSNGPSAYSNGYAAEKEVPSVKADRMTSVIQSTSVYQSSLAGVTGQRSMADIVKRERVRPQCKTLNWPTASYHVAWDTSELTSNNNDNICSDEDQSLGVHHNRVPSFQHASTTSCNWPPLERPAAGEIISVPECAVDSEMHPGKCNLSLNSADKHCEAAKVRELGGPVSVFTEELQQLSLPEDDRELPSNEDVPSVKFPDNLQVQTAECSHLSFGCFQPSKISTYSPRIEISVPIQNSLEADRSNYGDTSSADHADIRCKLHTDGLVRNASNGGLFHGVVVPEGRYDSSASSRPEEAKLINKFYFPSSSHDHSSDNYHSVNAAFNQNSSHVQSFALISNLMQSRTDLASSTMLAANSRLSREPDSQYIPFPTTPSMSNKYGNALPTIGDEALKAGGLMSTQHPLHNPGTDCASGPQQLALQSLGAYTDMIDYSAYVPSAFQQTSAGNGSLNYQSLGALIPQYKSSGVSASNLPQPISRQGVFANATSTHGKYLMDLPTSISGTSLLYGDGDVLSSWYNSNRQSLWHQQNGGYNSRTAASTAFHEAQIQRLKQVQQRPQSQRYTTPAHSQNGNTLLADQNQQQVLIELLLRSNQGQHEQSQMWSKYY